MDVAKTRVGFVGVGAIAAAMVEAMLTGPKAERMEVVLSPRSARRSADLADRFPAVRIAEDNPAVVDAADVVVLAVLPGQLPQVCAELAFRADQHVVGLAVGYPPSRLAGLVGPVASVSQLIPLPMIALHTGPVVLCPPVPEIVDLLEGCGEVVALDREEQIVALSCASATMSTFLAFETTTIDWLIQHGFSPEQSRDYVTALFGGLAVETRHTEPADLPTMPAEHETPGGLNEYLRRSMGEIGMYAGLTEHLDQLHRSWSRRDG